MKAHGSLSVIERGKYRACPIHLSSLFTSSGTHAAGTEDAFLAENTDLDSCSPLYLSLSSRFKQPKKPVRPRSVSTMHRFCYVHDSSFPLKFKFSAFLIAWAFRRFPKSNNHMLQISDRLYRKMRSTSYTSNLQNVADADTLIGIITILY